MDMLHDFIIGDTLRILVKAGKKKNSIIGFDKEKKAVIVEIAAPAQDNKANTEIIKFFSKQLKKKVRIKSGLTGKEKLLVIST